MTKFGYVTGSGAGNSFVIVDLLGHPDACAEDLLSKAHSALTRESRDSALIVTNDKVEGSAMRMSVLEKDGSLSDFCGNGARVVACYLSRAHGIREFFFRSRCGDHGIVYEDDILGVHMGPTLMVPNPRYVDLEAFELLNIDSEAFYYTETVEPHLVIGFKQISASELSEIGKRFNTRRDVFPLGINVNAAEVIDEQTIQVMTYERGVNGITKSCGTGSTSCASLARHLGLVAGDRIKVETEGGTLLIAFDGTGSATMFGPAEVDETWRDLS